MLTFEHRTFCCIWAVECAVKHMTALTETMQKLEGGKVKMKVHVKRALRTIKNGLSLSFFL